MTGKTVEILFFLFLSVHTAFGAARLDRDFTPASAISVKIQTTQTSLTIMPQKGFSLSECKPYLAWREVGQNPWNQTWADKMEVKWVNDNQLYIIANLDKTKVEINARKKEADCWEFSGTLTNQGSKPIELRRFHYLHGNVDQNKVGFLPLSGALGQQNMLIHDTESLSPSHEVVEKSWSQFYVFWPRPSDPIHDEPNWALAVDTGMILPSCNQAGWVLGATGPATAIGEIGLKTCEKPTKFFAGMLLDGVRLDPNESRILEKIIVYYGDWQEGLRLWARMTSDELGARPSQHSLTGFCSWYRKGSFILSDDIQKAIEQFATLPLPPGGRTIQIDDGFEVMPGDWRPNERFVNVWSTLPEKIRQTGSLPGLWIAPTAIYAKHDIVRKHPDWLQRMPDGRFAVSFSNWGYCSDPNWKWGPGGTQTYFLEIDRPEARQAIRGMFKQLLNEGWKYFKIDFTYGISSLRVPYDPKKTIMQTHRGLYALIREACGPDVLLNACIGQTGRFALGYADIARLGGDIGGSWSTIKSTLPELLLRVHTSGLWWQGDPDVFYLGQQGNLTQEERYLQTGTIGLMGGLMLTSDLPKEWSASDREFLSLFWTTAGPHVPSRHYVLWDAQGTPLAYLVSYEDGPLPEHRLGIYNWTDKPQNIEIKLDKLLLKPELKWELKPLLHYEEDIKLTSGNITVYKQPPHSIRIVKILGRV
jgi:hypothetical protein